MSSSFEPPPPTPPPATTPTPRKQRPTRLGKINKRIQTCDVCKVRHHKCSGTRPKCQHCTLRGLECVYSHNSAHTIDPSVTKKKSVGSAPSPRPSFHPLGSIEEYERLRNRIIEEIVPLVGCPPEKTYELTLRIVERVTAERTLQLHSLLTDRGFEETTELAFANALHQNFAGCPLDPEILRVEPLAQTPQIEYLSRRNFPSHQRAQHLKDRFLERVNSVLFVFEPNELEDGVNVIYSQLDSTLGSWRCQICLAFALAAQSCDSLQENEQAFMWYENGRRYLDDLVEEKGGELLAMRGLLLMAIYLIPDKKQACKLYLGMAISIGFSCGLGGSAADSKLSEEEYFQWRKVWRTLIFVDTWLAATLGTQPIINEYTCSDSIFSDDFELSDPSDPKASARELLVRMAVLIGQSSIVKQMLSSLSPSKQLYGGYVAKSQQWGELYKNAFPLEQTQWTSLKKWTKYILIYPQIHCRGMMVLLLRSHLLREVQLGTGVLNVEGGESLGPMEDYAHTCIISALELIGICGMLKDEAIFPPKDWFLTDFLFNSCLLILTTLVWKENLSSEYSLPSGTNQHSQKQLEHAVEKAAQLLYSCGQGYPLARKYAIIVGTLKKYVTRPAVTPSLSDIGTASGIPQHLSPISMLVDGTSHIGSLDAMGQMDLHLPPGGPVPLQLTSESGITLTGPPGPLRIVPPSLSGNLYNAYRLWLPTTLQSPTDSSSTEIPPLPSANQARQEALTRLRPPYTVSDFLSTAGYPQPQQLQQEQLLQQLQPPQLPGSLDVQGIHSFVFPESATDGYLQDVGASGPQMLGGFPPTDSGRRRGLGAMDGVGAGRRGSQQQQQQQVQPGGPPPGAFPVQQQQQQPPPGFPR